METLDIIRRMQELLARERAAIARLDGVEVLSLAGEKMALAQALESKTLPERRQAGRQLKALVRGLQTNGVLLSHARGILSDLLRGQGVTLRGGVKTSTLRPLSSSAARHLSVRG